MRRIFISYRKSDSEGETGRLFSDLKKRFGEGAIFRYVEATGPGDEFPQAIKDALAICKVMLVVIGPTWATTADELGRRLDQPGDYVRMEVANGLARQDVCVIPVRVGGAKLPNQNELPSDLQPLHLRVAVELSDDRWDYDVKRLGDAVAKNLGIALPPAAMTWTVGGTALAALLVGILYFWHPWSTDTISAKQEISQPDRAILKFWIRGAEASRPILSFLQKHPVFEQAHNIAPESDGHYQLPVEWPDPRKYKSDKYFEAKAERAVTVSENGANAVAKPTQLCFTTNPKPPTNNSPLEVLMQCFEGEKCSLSPDDNGWATAIDCPKEAGSIASPPFSLLPAMWADSQGQTSQAPGWKVPSLATLQKMSDSNRVGYTQFNIKANSLSGLEGADSFRYEIRANGAPLYIDGWPSEDMLKQFDPAKGLDFSFGMENLSFSGADHGCESIDVLLEFRKGNQTIKKIQLTRLYAALRDAASEQQSAGGLTFTWSGNYVKPRNEDKFEVFLISTTDLNEASRIKSRIDRANLSYAGMKVVGVQRPPLNNPTYGVVAGLLQPTGQVKFTFDKTTAQQLLAWTRDEHNHNRPVFPQLPFPYEMKPGESGLGALRSCSTALNKQ
jgi:TIR domain